jgi:hypothetical protein
MSALILHFDPNRPKAARPSAPVDEYRARWERLKADLGIDAVDDTVSEEVQTCLAETIALARVLARLEPSALMVASTFMRERIARPKGDAR